MSNLLGNTHSTSTASQLSTRLVEDIRLRALQFFNASPDDFDLVFVANATAGIKLIMEAFRDHENGFWYGYHKDAHTSVVGVREVAASGHHCFASDLEVEEWIRGSGVANSQTRDAGLGLFAYPAQSNLNGRRLPLSWVSRIRSSIHAKHQNMYTLLDAASFVSTSLLDLSNISLAPDYTVLSFYKIFGFPDLGAIIIRKATARPLQRRRYFGGGTVEMVTCSKEQWHIKKQNSLHEQLEDGTLPIHSIVALGAAFDVHKRLYGSIERVSCHTSLLAKQLNARLSSLHHKNDRKVCKIYADASSTYDDPATQGPIVALSLQNSKGEWISNSEIEKLALIKNIQIRTGGLCNPGGIASLLELAPWEMKRNFSSGQRCGNDNDIMGGKPTGVIRLSLGAMSTLQDVTTFLQFVEEFFIDDEEGSNQATKAAGVHAKFYIEKLAIYPIKSCGGWSIPPNMLWDVRAEGLAWDREWCLIHQGTHVALSQKRYPKMALLKPWIDLENGLLRVRYSGPGPLSIPAEVSVPLSIDPAQFIDQEDRPTSRVCDDPMRADIYVSNELVTFFTTIVGAPCTLARFSVDATGRLTRHSKAHLQPHQTRFSSPRGHNMPGAFPLSPSAPSAFPIPPRPILLSNESPILTISRSSLNRLNEHIKGTATGKAVPASAFRANLILVEEPSSPPGMEQPYVEDTWRYMRLIPRTSTTTRNIDDHRPPHNSPEPEPQRPRESATFELLGACRRCHMVCVNQRTGERGEEPFATLAKTRRVGGKVFFGVHTGLVVGEAARIGVGDQVVPVMEGEGNGKEKGGDF